MTCFPVFRVDAPNNNFLELLHPTTTTTILTYNPQSPGPLPLSLFTMILKSSSLPHLLALSTATASSTPKLPPLHPKFHAHIKCPYANQWITKGPEQAAIDLGLGRHLSSDQQDISRRHLEESVMGSCTYTNPFSGDSCAEFRGTGWTTEVMSERCSQESSSSFVGNEACLTDENTAGYCVKSVTDNMYEYNMLVLTSMADCAGNKLACETFVGGSFIAADACKSEGSSLSGSMTNPFDFSSFGSSEPTTCGIAPGAIGAAHQNAFSAGMQILNYWFH